MKKAKLDSEEISYLCLELALLLHSGLEIGDGLHVLADDMQGGVKAAVLTLAGQVERGTPLSGAMKSSGVFPVYVCSLTTVGERTGRTEETLRALAAYYDDRTRLEERIRDALLYPSVLLILMLIVIAVLLIKVLPVFNDVFASLGGQLTGLAGGLLTLGKALNRGMPVLWAVLALCAAFLTVFSTSVSFRAAILRRRDSRRGDRGLSGKIAFAHFAQALAMGLQSGLPVEDALDLASSLGNENAAVSRRYHDCRSRLDEGAGLAEALRDSGMMPAAYSRMLALGIRSGAGDTVMQEISRRMSGECEDAIAALVGRVEPAMVIVTSVLVGVILLSVMLPLMNIMTTIG